MTQILELAQLVQHDGVTDVDVWRRRIESELDAQRHARGFRACELGQPLGLGQQLVATALRGTQGGQHAVSDRMRRPFDARRIGRGGLRHR